MDNIEKIHAALSKLNGRSIVQELSKYINLPASGLVAGQALASIVMARLGISAKGPINDVDVFMSTTTSYRAKQMEEEDKEKQMKRKSVLATHTTESSMIIYENDYALNMRETIKHGYKILTTRKEGMLNEVAYEKISSDEHISEARSLIDGFDLNCTQIAINPSTGELTWTPQFALFLVTYQLEIETASTPFHTATRYFRKKQELGCKGDDELNMSICALPSLLGAFKDKDELDLPGYSYFENASGRYGQKNHQDFLRFEKEISPWFSEKRVKNFKLWTMEYDFKDHGQTLETVKKAIAVVKKGPCGYDLDEYLVTNAKSFCKMVLNPNAQDDLRQKELEILLTAKENKKDRKYSSSVPEAYFLALNARIKNDPFLKKEKLEKRTPKIVSQALQKNLSACSSLSSFDLEKQAECIIKIVQAQKKYAEHFEHLKSTNRSVLDAILIEENWHDNNVLSKILESDEFLEKKIVELAFCEGIHHNLLKTVKWAISKGVNPDDCKLINIHKNESALECAARNGYHEIVHYLISLPGLSLNKKNYLGESPLMVAIKNDRIEVVKILLPCSNFDSAENYEQSVLHSAIEWSAFECVKWLANESVCAQKDTQGNNALLIAAKGHKFSYGQNKQEEILNHILTLSNPRSMNNKGESALMIAARSAYGSVFCDILLRHCDPSWVDYEGKNALMYACETNRIDAFKILLPHSDPWEKDFNDFDCLDHAYLSIKKMGSKSSEIAIILEDMLNVLVEKVAIGEVVEQANTVKKKPRL